MKNVKESLNKTETWAFNDLIPWLTTTNFTPSAHGLNIGNSGSITYTMQGISLSANFCENEVFKLYLQGDTTNIPINTSDGTVDSFQLVTYYSGDSNDAPYLNPTITYDPINDRTEYKFLVSYNNRDCNWIFFYHKLNGTQSKPAISYLEDLFIEMVHEYVHWSSEPYLHKYGDIEIETKTEITTRNDSSLYLKWSNKTFAYASNYKGVSAWPVTPGDKIAFRVTNSPFKTVEYYTDSSQTLSTNRIYWGVAPSITTNGTFYPTGNLQDRYIEGVLYKEFTVPEYMNYLVAGYTAGSAFALDTNLTVKIYKIETSTQKGWKDQNMYYETEGSWH